MNTGTLYLIASPIGNLKDITLRALDILKTVDCIASEDTRRTKKLLMHYDIHTPLVSYHDYSSESQREHLIRRLQDGASIGLISDAGTPLINDPGFKLVRSCIEKNIAIVAIPGASSVITAVIVSGLPPDRFIYWGYLPQKEGKRSRDLERIKSLGMTTVILESPYRIVKSLTTMKEILGDRKIAVCREMTKMFEEIFRGTVSDALERFSADEPKGEFTLVIAGEHEELSDTETTAEECE